MRQPNRQGIRRIDETNPAAVGYRDIEVVKTEEVVVLDQHELLDYARLRAEVAHAVKLAFDVADNRALIGFLTGSLGPTVEARLIVGPKWPNRV